MIFSEFDPSRRRTLKAGIALGLSAATFDLTPNKIINYSSLAYEYGPAVALAILKNPQVSIEAFDLWRTPDRKYRKSTIFNEPLVYKRGAANNVLGFGDSNLEGAEGKGEEWKQSPLNLYVDLAIKEKGFKEWKGFDCAKSGSTTETVIENQITSPKAREGFRKGVRCDVWVNVGGNDVSSLVQNLREADELEKVASDPFANMELLFKYVERIEDNINGFRGNFERLLNAINHPLFAENEQPNIRQMIIMTIPDFARASTIKTQEFNGRAKVINLTNPAIKRLVGNIAVKINEAMVRAAEDFQTDSGVRVVGIDTSVPDISDFSNHQHFSTNACGNIAKTAISRLIIND